VQSQPAPNETPTGSVLDWVLLMALNPETIVWARIGVSDMLLTACMEGVVPFFSVCPALKPVVQARWYPFMY